jgi:hypothetical protein
VEVATMVSGPDAMQVILSDRAVADYSEIRDRAATCFKSKPPNPDLFARYLRTKRLLGELRSATSVAYDQALINDFSWLLTRSDATTYVYYVRVAELRTVIVVHLCEGVADIQPLLPEIVYSGRTALLTALGITPPPIPEGFSVSIH